MKKIIYSTLIVIILIPTSIFGQIKSGIIIYDIDMERFGQNDTTKNKPSAIVQLTRDMAKDIKVELYFNNNKSVFKTQKSLAVNKNQEMFDFVKSLISGGIYFTDLEKQQYLNQRKYRNETYNIVSGIEDIEWKITKIKKKIGKFTCYKAEYKKIIAEKERLIIAWYTPKVPVRFGPLNYSNMLPGLIMELDTPMAKYTCSEIKLNPKKEIKIEWPSETNTMTRAEYLKMGEENSTWRQN